MSAVHEHVVVDVDVMSAHKKRAIECDSNGLLRDRCDSCIVTIHCTYTERDRRSTRRPKDVFKTFGTVFYCGKKM